jgi:hydrogenase maturation protease
MLDGGYERVLMLDAAPRGEAPGTLYVLAPEVDAEAVAVETHGMNPMKVLAMVQALGGTPPPTLVVGCEPQHCPDPDDDELVAELSEPVRAAIDEAVRVVELLLEERFTQEGTEVTLR